MTSEYIREMAYGRSGGAVFYLLVSLALLAVLFGLLVWVLGTHNRENKMFVQRVMMLLLGSAVFIFFLVEGIKASNLANRLYIDSIKMEVEEETGVVQDRYGYAHNLYIVIDGVSYIYKENENVDIGKNYKIEYFKYSKLINKLEEND